MTTGEHQAVPVSLQVPLRMRLRRMFFTGVVILVPVALSGYVLVQLFRFMDGIFAPRIQAWIDPFIPGFYIPGLGLILTLMVVLLLGWLSNNIAGKRVVAAIERLIARIPIGGAVYLATKGVMEALARDKSEAFKRVVLIEYPRQDMFAVAFVTGSSSWPDIHERTADFVMVFLPTTPNPTSGYLLLVPRDQTIPLPITIEEGVRLVISGGILLPASLERMTGESSSQ
jgi:uncharacterized membrane protein